MRAQEFMQGVSEGRSNDTAITLSRLGKFHPGVDTLAEFVPERAGAQYALHPDKWESTFYSLTNKDSYKLKYYGPKEISIPPGTLVGDMAIANKFYRAKTQEEKQQHAEAYKASLQPYPVDVTRYRMPELLIPRQGVSEGSLAEFAPDSSGDGGDDGFSEETLKRLAAQWWQGDEDPRVERTLAAAGWEIGQDESYDDEPGVFVVQAGDVNGNSYISWPAHELKGVSEGWRENLAAAGIAGALATATPAQAQVQPTASADPIVATVVIDGEQRRLDLSAKNFGDVREAERWLAKFMRDRGIRDWQGKIERGEPGSGRYQRVTIQGAGGLDEQDVSEDRIKESKTMEVVVIGPNRRLEKRRIRIDPTTRDPVDAIIRYYARLRREVFGIEGRPVDRAKAVAEGSIITEVPQGVMNILRQELPGWPDYVIKDMVYNKLKSPQDLESKLEHVRHLAQEAKSWRLVQGMPLTFNMLDPETQQRMKLRKFGDANPFKIPNDRERFEHALELVKTKGMENLPPVIFKQTANGLELWEGWHRTLAAFRLHPKMFRVNAWIGSNNGEKQNEDQ